MARNPAIEARLQRWADWRTAGDGSGYPSISTLHRSWQPGSPGIAPTMKVSRSSDVRATERAVNALSERMAMTVKVHYLLTWMSLEEQAQTLGCSVSTVVARVERAHHLLRAAFCIELEAG
jgi:DNA-directed RNA polymerase specialized sigma24 family protein